MNKKEALLQAIDIVSPNAEQILFKYSISLNTFISVISKEKYNLKEIGKSSVTISKLIRELFPSKYITSLHTKVCTYILQEVGIKVCGKCTLALFLESFRPNVSRDSGVNTYCKDCQVKTTSATQAYRQSAYRAKKLLATMPWTEFDLIKRFYTECPEGYTVDHIVPLQGVNVSGLHVLSNLQYLTPSANSQKGNRFNA